MPKLGNSRILLGRTSQPNPILGGFFFCQNGKVFSGSSRVSEGSRVRRIGFWAHEFWSHHEMSATNPVHKESLRSSSAISSRITVSSVSKAARSAAFVLHTFRLVVFQCWVWPLSCHAFWPSPVMKIVIYIDASVSQPDFFPGPTWKFAALPEPRCDACEAPTCHFWGYWGVSGFDSW